jgi:ClpX C4-type zinc finger protein
MLRCSFCRRPDADVAKLVAGPVRLFSRRVYICDQCAAEANRIMDAHPGGSQARVKAFLLGRTFVRLSRWRHKTLMAVAR